MVVTMRAAFAHSLAALQVAVADALARGSLREQSTSCLLLTRALFSGSWADFADAAVALFEMSGVDRFESKVDATASPASLQMPVSPRCLHGRSTQQSQHSRGTCCELWCTTSPAMWTHCTRSLRSSCSPARCRVPHVLSASWLSLTPAAGPPTAALAHHRCGLSKRCVHYTQLR